MGADAMAVVAYVRGPNELDYMKHIVECISAGNEYKMSVIVHIYPRRCADTGVTI
jgi:DhnA family fructose-bisphosphate aldolase class Ia